MRRLRFSFRNLEIYKFTRRVLKQTTINQIFSEKIKMTVFLKRDNFIYGFVDYVIYRTVFQYIAN